MAYTTGRTRVSIILCLSVLQLCTLIPSAHACTQIAAGETLWIRLLDPIASYSAKPGIPVRAMLVQSPQCDGAPAFAAGSEVDGSVKSVRRVGLGLIHETARIEVVFDRIVPTGEPPLSFHSTVVEISNARESVHKGVIHGIRSTDSPQGRITSRLKYLPTWNPYTDWFLLSYRLAFPITPEPEIYLPPGADLRLQLSEPLTFPERPLPPSLFSAFNDLERLEIDAEFGSAPERTTTRKGQAADLVNLAFLGTREQLDAAFRAAGWRQSDPTSTHSVLRQFRAFISFQNYPTAPMSRQLLSGETSDENWEKGLNSYGKRDHLRIWQDREANESEPIWLSAFVRETGATLSVHNHRFIHHVDADLDGGRDLVIRDLALAGCVDAVETLPRPALAHFFLNATGDPMRTQGGLTVVRLKKCENGLFDYSAVRPQVQARPHSKVARYVRTEILTYRSDVVRGNIIYGLFDLTRMSIQGLRHRHAREAMVARKPDVSGTDDIIEGLDAIPPSSRQISAENGGSLQVDGED
jgi:hypothetical protein